MNFSKNLLELIGDYICIGISRFIFDDISPKEEISNMKRYDDSEIAVDIIKYFLGLDDTNERTLSHIIRSTCRLNNMPSLYGNGTRNIIINMENKDSILNEFVNRLTNNKQRFQDIFYGKNYLTWLGNMGAKCDDTYVPLLITDIIDTSDVNHVIRIAVKYDSIDFIDKLLYEYSLTLDSDKYERSMRKYKKLVQIILDTIKQARRLDLLDKFIDIMDNYSPTKYD